MVLAPEGSDTGSASAVAEAVRRGCRVVVACPPGSLVAEHAAGRDSTVLPCASGDQLATAVVMLQFLDRLDLGPDTDPEAVAQALDDVAIACSPYRDLAVNPAKMLAIALADSTPLVWGGSVLAARAARRVAESVRRASGRTALAGDAEHLLPVIAGGQGHRPVRRPVRRRRRRRPARRRWWSSTTAPTAPSIREQRGRLTVRGRGPPGPRGDGLQRRRPPTSPATPRCWPPAPTPPPTSASACPAEPTRRSVRLPVTQRHPRSAPAPQRAGADPCPPKAAPRRSWRRCWPTPASR